MPKHIQENIKMLKNGISIIGAGNVATHLALAINNAHFNIKQIVSKTENSASKLAKKVDAEVINDLRKLDLSVDLIILSVNDDAIINILRKIKIEKTFIVHTAGSVDMNIFESFAVNYGVFYPVQTFSKERKIDFNNVPLGIEANSKSNREILKQFAKKLSNNVSDVNSIQRKKIHLAAVFACNFVNHMYNIASNLLRDNNVSDDIIKPLIMETAMKVMNDNPNSLQTGPAIRNDNLVIANHLEMLKDYEEWQNIYNFVSKNIKNINK
ncbi:MAG: DUF2520 domain-containing protein [Bacteroidales bacterium]|jgi:predicted short-subunit dehydrogenase-like oxidoreductase (DUF2520 family)|nr:DUF2520 domain-containing protein [Bacteroidales bacterium]